MTEVVHIGEEAVDRFWPEGRDLVVLHWGELEPWRDIPLDLALDRYRALEAAGLLCLVTVRVGLVGTLVGYGSFVVSEDLHHAQSRRATQDALFVHPRHRAQGIGQELVHAAEQALKARGCQVVYHLVKDGHPALGRLLEAQGYTALERLYGKRLDR